MIINVGEIRLRRPEPKDVEALYSYRNDPYIVEALGGFSKGYSRADMTEWVERQRKNTQDIVWVIADAQDQCIGHCGIYQINHITGVADVAVCMGTASFRKGQSRSIMKAVFNYAFEQLNLRKLRGDILGTNKPSINLSKRFGMKQECVLRDEQQKNGKYVDMHVFGLFRRDWNPDMVKCLPDYENLQDESVSHRG